METRTVPVGTTLYHGSVRLYQIQCYYRKLQPLLASYLATSILSSDTLTIPPQVWQKLEALYARYNETYFTYQVVTKETLYLAALELLSQYKQLHVSIYAVLDELLPPSEPDSADILNFAYDVENGAGNAFAPEFYSVMRLPVQFFTEVRDLALSYAKRGEELTGGLYHYQVTKTVRLPEVSNPVTMRLLGDTIFTSKIPFSQEELLYYTGYDTAAGTRFSIYRGLLVAHAEPTVLNLLLSVCKSTGFALPRGRDGKLYATLVLDVMRNWFNYFREDILTPSALWHLTCWNYQDNGAGANGRITLYDADALLLKVLVEDGTYAGYSDKDNNELVIISPEYYGKMRLEDRTDAVDNCDYL